MLDNIKNPYNGDEWEKTIDKCYQLRYQSDGYQKVPANYQGDAGIEGYTKSGIVYQCYCPEKNYSDEDLWEKQRDKITKDIKKLIKNGERFNAMGVIKIKEWHFVTPEYRDSRLLVHCETKRQEIIKAKRDLGLDYIDDDIKILIKVGEDFIPEVNKLKYLNNHKFDIRVKNTEIIDYNECDSEKLKNIERKIGAIVGVENDSIPCERYDKLVSIMVDFYLKGIRMKSNLRQLNIDLYEKIISLDAMFKNEIEMKCLMQLSGAIPGEIYQDILEDFGNKLKEEMEEILTVESISELKWNLLSAWLADCPLEFY